MAAIAVTCPAGCPLAGVHLTGSGAVVVVGGAVVVVVVVVGGVVVVVVGAVVVVVVVQTRTYWISVVAGNGVTPGMKLLVPIPSAWVRLMKNGWSKGWGLV
jgi:hypothetical protein